MVLAYALRRLKIKAWWVYVLGPGAASWIGLINAHLHPALALVFARRSSAEHPACNESAAFAQLQLRPGFLTVAESFCKKNDR